VTQPGQLTLDTAVPPARVLPGHRHHQLRGRHGSRRPARMCMARMGPPPRDQPTMPSQQRVRRDTECLPPATRGIWRASADSHTRSAC
jgi:hypothetical protein